MYSNINLLMVNFETCRNLALSIPDVTEEPHFEKPSFRINGKIFMTFHTDKNEAMLILPELEQSVLTAYDSSVIYPVKGFWGNKGATMFDLKKVKKSMFKDALQSAYTKAAQKSKKQTKKLK